LSGNLASRRRSSSTPPAGSPDLALALDDQAQRHRLHAPGRQAFAPDLLAQQRAELVADQAVEDAARLLGVHALLIDRARLRERRGDRIARDLVKFHAVHRAPARHRLEHGGQVPGDRLAFAVGVGGQVDFRGLARKFAQARHDRAHILARVFAGRDHVARLEIVLEVDAQAVLGQIAHVADRSLDVITGAEKLADGAGLGRGFDDHQFLPVARRLRLAELGVLRRAPHAVHLRTADRAHALRGRRARGSEQRARVGHLTLGLTFYAIGFHSFSQPEVLSAEC
jgi:hypothetical protein